MFELQYPWLLLLLPLPLAMAYVPAREQRDAALRAPFFARARQLLGQHAGDPQQQLRRKHWLLWLIWSLALLAASAPKWVGEPVQLPAEGRDLMLAVDMSASMSQTDMALQGRRATRLMAVKSVVGDFVERRKSDRLGLILFADQAYLQAPLTFDRQTVNQLLQEAEIGIAGRATAIGDAIGLAVKRLRDRPASSRVLVLLTDGANTAGELQPSQAAELAAQAGVKIYTIAFGADSMEVPGIFGTRRINPSADLDETGMRDLADKTGGQYFRARTTQELDAIHHQLDQLEPIEADAEKFRPEESLFYWPLAVALLLSFGLALARLQLPGLRKLS